MMYCEKCGNPLTNGRAFCTNCGAIADSGQAAGSVSEENVQLPSLHSITTHYVQRYKTQRPSASKKYTNDVGLRILSLLISLLAGVMQLFSFTLIEVQTPGGKLIREITNYISGADEWIALILVFAFFSALYIALAITLFFSFYSTSKGGMQFWGGISAISIFFLMFTLTLLYVVIMVNVYHDVIKVNFTYYLLIVGSIAFSACAITKYIKYKQIFKQEQKEFYQFAAVYNAGLTPYNNNYNGYNNYNKPMM